MWVRIWIRVNNASSVWNFSNFLVCSVNFCYSWGFFDGWPIERLNFLYLWLWTFLFSFEKNHWIILFLPVLLKFEIMDDEQEIKSPIRRLGSTRKLLIFNSEYQRIFWTCGWGVLMNWLWLLLIDFIYTVYLDNIWLTNVQYIIIEIRCVAVCVKIDNKITKGLIKINPRVAKHQ